MLHKRLRLSASGQARRTASVRPGQAHHHARTPGVSPASPLTKLDPAAGSRPGWRDLTTAALSYESVSSHDDVPVSDHAVSSLRLTAEAEAEASAGMVTTRFVVPKYVTKPGQQLFLTGSTPELGEWDPNLAVPLEWQEGHQHSAVLRLPSSRVVQVKLLLKEDGQPAFTEEGDPRDIMLMPTNESPAAGAGAQGGAGPAAPRASAGPRLDYQIMCHFGNSEAVQILRLPVLLPAKQPGDRRVLCKFVVLLDQVKLEARQYPVVVGSAEELGGWNTAAGVKLMRQVGGYWTRRVELPLHGNEIQAKVVVCSPDGQPVQWEPGTDNRVLAAPPGFGPGGPSMMHIFVCRWGHPELSAVVSVPVEYEDANKEYIKMLDAAQREIGVMRKAVTAKSRQCQGLESELAASRRAERALREEVGMLRGEMGYLIQEVEEAQKGELAARQETAEVQAQLQELGENYERQISFLESKLDEMEAEIIALQEQLAAANQNGNGNGHVSYKPETQQVMSRSSWR